MFNWNAKRRKKVGDKEKLFEVIVAEITPTLKTDTK